ncbi:transglycosylase family protein [Kitasatospora sp. NPDC056531]|uniref:transglycosylase family protein n=1 Tax=Kitasatospora sp. NPDC056531 TaxID=3345856 RepID=UPI0036A28156
MATRKSMLLRIAVALPTIAIGTLTAATPSMAASVATWDKVAQCESTGNWSINTGNGYYGGLQINMQNWQSYGGTAYASRPDLATKQQQILIAEKILADQGAGAWGCAPGTGLDTDKSQPYPDPPAAPSVSVSQLVGDQSGAVFLSASASGSGGASLSTQFFVDGRAVGSDTGSNPVVVWDTTSVAGGTHQVTAVTTASNAGGSASTTSSAVAASVENYSMMSTSSVTDKAGTVHVFRINQGNGHLTDSYRPKGGKWAAQDLNTKAGFTYAQAGAPAAVVDNSGGIHVFTRKADDGSLIETVDYKGDNNWGEEILNYRANYTYAMSDSPAAVVDKTGGIHVFTRKANDGSLIETVDYKGDNNWGEEILNNRANYTYAMGGSPSAVVDNSGGIHVFTRKANDGNLIETVDYKGDNNWGEEILNNRANYTYAMSDSPAAVVDKTGGIHVFTRKADDGSLIETVDYKADNNWGEEILNYRANYTYAMGGSPSAVVDNSGGIHVFTRKANDGNLIETVDYKGDNNWGEEILNNRANYTYAMSDSPAAVVDKTGGIHVFTRKADDGSLIETVDYKADNNWGEEILNYRANYTYAMGGSPSAVVDNSGGIHVFTRKANDGNLIETVDYKADNNWGEEILNNRANYTYAMTGSAAATVDATGGIHVFTQKPNDRDLIETVDYKGDNNWAEQALTGQTGA